MIELLVTMTMIAIISSAVFAGRGNMEKDLALQRTVYKLSQDFRTVSEMTMGSAGGFCSGGKEACGHGLYFGKTSYGFFIDCAPDCASSNNRKDGQDDIILYDVLFEKGIEIIDTIPNALSVLFSPPDPIVYINGVGWGSEATITFGVDEKTRQVKINSAGRVEILTP